MATLTAREYLRAATQRLEAAQALYQAGYTLDAQYVGGYTVECSLKAIILSVAEPPGGLPDIAKGAKMHTPERLLGILRDQGVALPPRLAKRLRPFDWTTELRYETGRRPTGQTRGFLRTASEFRDWAESFLP